MFTKHNIRRWVREDISSNNMSNRLNLEFITCIIFESIQT